jgi:hypothetical protein
MATNFAAACHNPHSVRTSKDVVARPLACHLTSRGVSVWFDEYELVLGDSLRGRIADGLRHSRVSVVILSRSFFACQWPQWELDGLTARQIAGETNVILPVWHDVELEDVRSYSPPLADLLAVRSSGGVEPIADQIIQVLAGSRPATSRTLRSQRSRANPTSPSGHHSPTFHSTPSIDVPEPCAGSPLQRPSSLLRSFSPPNHREVLITIKPFALGR